MANMSNIRDALGNAPCRRCINNYFDVYLQPKDCKYYPHEYTCTNCHWPRHVVRDLTITGKAKMLPKRA